MATLMLVNPRKRRRNKTRKNPAKRRHRKMKRNPLINLFGGKHRRKRSHKRSHKRHMRRNPIGSGVSRTMGSFKSAVPQIIKPAALAAVGAVSLDVLWGYLPIPVAIKTGVYAHVAKAAGAVALGVLGAKVLGRDTAMKFATGAMTVVLYGVIRDFVAKQFPAVRLGEYPGYGELAYVSSGQVAGLGMYDYPDVASMNPAPMSLPTVGLPDDDGGLGLYTQ